MAGQASWEPWEPWEASGIAKNASWLPLFDVKDFYRKVTLFHLSSEVEGYQPAGMEITISVMSWKLQYQSLCSGLIHGSIIY